MPKDFKNTQLVMNYDELLKKSESQIKKYFDKILKSQQQKLKQTEKNIKASNIGKTLNKTLTQEKQTLLSTINEHTQIKKQLLDLKKQQNKIDKLESKRAKLEVKKQKHVEKRKTYLERMKGIREKGATTRAKLRGNLFFTEFKSTPDQTSFEKGELTKKFSKQEAKEFEKTFFKQGESLYSNLFKNKRGNQAEFAKAHIKYAIALISLEADKHHQKVQEINSRMKPLDQEIASLKAQQEQQLKTLNGKTKSKPIVKPKSTSSIRENLTSKSKTYSVTPAMIASAKRKLNETNRGSFRT